MQSDYNLKHEFTFDGKSALTNLLKIKQNNLNVELFKKKVI